MLKPTFLIIACFILVLAGTSQASGVLGILTNLFSSNPSCGGVFPKVAQVQKFIKTFQEEVKNSPTLQDLFDLTKTTPQQYADFEKRHTTKVLIKTGVDEQTATTIGNFAAKSITQEKELTTSILSRLIPNIAANFDYAEGFLKPDNAVMRAKKLSKAMAESANSTITKDPTSKFPAVNNGFDKFFRENGEFTPDKAPILGCLVGVQWFIEANNKCS